MLQNDREDWVVAEQSHEAIIDKADWLAAQKKMEQNTKHPGGSHAKKAMNISPAARSTVSAARRYTCLLYTSDAADE